MVQQVKCLPGKPEYDPRIHIWVEEEKQIVKLSSDLQTSHTAIIINNFKSSLCEEEVKQQQQKTRKKTGALNLRDLRP